MKFSEFTLKIWDYWVFTTAMLKTLFGDRRKYMARLISERTKKDRLLQLKKWVYLINTSYILSRFHPFWLANKIQEPSYISTYSALEFYNLIPEKVSHITSITSTKTNKFINKIGAFSYQKIKSELFWWYKELVVQNQKIFIAKPEKALLDLIYLTNDQNDFINFFRLQHLENINIELLEQFANRFASPKIHTFLVYFKKHKDDWYSPI